MKRKIKSTRWKLVDGMFRSIFITSAIIEFSNVGSAFIDGLIISRFLGAEAIAGEGIAHPFFSIVGVISGLIAVGMQISCSRLLGRGRVKDMNRYFSQSVYVATGLSLILTAVILLFSEPIAVLLGASGKAASLVAPASQYLFGLSVGVPAQILVAVLAPAIQLDSGRKLIQRGAILCSVTDITMDLLAVWLGLGIRGVGFATAASYIVNVAYLCLHFRKKDRMLRFVKPDVPLGEFVGMLLNGTEKAIKRLVNVIRPVVLNTIIISYGGAVAMSALSIRNNLSGFTEIVAIGIASAVSMLTGLYYGEVNEEAITEVRICEYRNTFLFSSAVCLVLVLFPRPVTRLYLPHEGEAFEMAVFAIQMLGIQTILQTLLKSRVSYLQAINRKVNMTVLVFASQLVIILLTAFVMGRLFGVYGILASFAVSDAVSLLAVYAYYQIKHLTFLPGRKELLNLPAEFELRPGDVISLDVRSMEDVPLAAEQIDLFCRGHRYSPKICYYASLAFEELAANIIQYGFPQNKKKDPMIDLRVVALEDDLILRIRDDCPHFDITKRIAEVNADDSDPTSGYGIRITSRIARDIAYTSAFETNNIIITYSDPKKA